MTLIFGQKCFFDLNFNLDINYQTGIDSASLFLNLELDGKTLNDSAIIKFLQMDP